MEPYKHFKNYNLLLLLKFSILCIWEIHEHNIKYSSHIQLGV